MEFEKKHWIGISLGAAVIILSLAFLSGDPNLMWFVIVLSLIAISIPFVVTIALQSGKQKEIEVQFLAFIRDLVENVKSGTPISKSIVNLRNRDYGPLSAHVNKLANQIALGIPLSAAFITFARGTKSSVIARAISLVSEAERAGGAIDTILESVAKSVNQIDILKKERKSAVYSLVVQGYIIFMIFIVIMLVLQYKILPLTAGLAGAKTELTITQAQLTPEAFSRPLFYLLLVQSLFSGLVIGKISEGSIKDGVRHSFILVAITLLVSTGAKVLLG